MEIYGYSSFYVMTVLTTVGYGSHSYYNSEEYTLSLVLMFLASFYTPFVYFIATYYGVTFFNPYKSMRNSYNSKIMSWLRKIQDAGEGLYLTPTMTGDILHHIDNAFTFDHDMIVEEFEFYQMLPPKD